MVNVKKYKSVKYLAAKDAGEYQGKKFTIDTVFPATIQNVEKLCVRLKGIENPVALNQTNLTLLSTAFGDETEGWINKKVTLTISKVETEGEFKGMNTVQLQPSQ